MVPRTTCAPGYRANAVTMDLWRVHGIEAVQNVGAGLPERVDGLLEIGRNVFFEPALEEGDVVGRALAQAKSAVARSVPIVICTHSINYLSRFVGAAERSREGLRKLLRSLLEDLPDLRFARTLDLVDAWTTGNSDWFLPRGRTLRSRQVAT